MEQIVNQNCINSLKKPGAPIIIVAAVKKLKQLPMLVKILE